MHAYCNYGSGASASESLCVYLFEPAHEARQLLFGCFFVTCLLVLSGLGRQWPIVIMLLSTHHCRALFIALVLLGIILSEFANSLNPNEGRTGMITLVTTKGSRL